MGILRPRRLNSLWLVLLLAALYLLVTGRFIPDQQKVERMMNTTLPTSATDVQIQYFDGRDDSFFLRLRLPAYDFPAFINKLCENGTADLGTDYNEWAMTRYNTPDWWITESTPISISGQCYRALSVEIFVNQSDSAEYVLYINGFSS